MKRFEEIVTEVCQNGAVNCMEAATISAVFLFTEQVFNEGGKVYIDKFNKRFGKHAYDKVLEMIGQRRH